MSESARGWKGVVVEPSRDDLERDRQEDIAARTTYTPGKRSEKVDDCGCKLERTATGLHMASCPLHAAAPDLLEACKGAICSMEYAIYAKGLISCEEALQNIKAAITQAEGR